MSKATTDKVIAAATDFTPRQRAVAAMALLDESGISARVFENIAKILADNIHDGIEYDQMDNETHEEACVRVAAAEKLLINELNFNVELED